MNKPVALLADLVSRRERLEMVWDRRLVFIILCCSVVCIGYAFLATPHVMPNFYNDALPLSERLTSTSMGDSRAYGRYADGLLRYGAFQNADGSPAVKHMPGLPLILAMTFDLTGSPDSFRVFQILFFFVSLYFFLMRIKDRFPAGVPAATAVIMALHPLMAQHFTAVMSDVLFASIFLWVAVVLYKTDPDTRDFLVVGLLLGLAVYLRESALPFMAALGMGYLVKRPSTYFKPVILMACAFLVVLSPWVIRNYAQTREFIPVTSKSTNLFYLSSIPLTAELYNPFSPGYDYKKLRKSYAEVPPGPDPIGAGLRNYISRPREQLISGFLKTTALLNRPGLLRRPLSSAGRITLAALKGALYIFHIGVLLFGLFLAFSRYAGPFPYLRYVIAAQYVQALFFWSEGRYLMPFYPFLILMALTWYRSQWQGRFVGQGTVSSGERR